MKNGVYTVHGLYMNNTSISEELLCICERAAAPFSNDELDLDKFVLPNFKDYKHEKCSCTVIIAIRCAENFDIWHVR